MAVHSTDAVIRSLRSVLGLDGAGPPDAELLRLFAENGDQAAFDALVRRHGSLVMSVCRRILGVGGDAEDAFQATFLVFVRKAANLRKRDAVGSWLHGVAQNISRQLLANAAVRRRHEANSGAAPTSHFLPTANCWLMPVRIISLFSGMFRPALN